jgi:biopolymer transport protein ExbD
VSELNAGYPWSWIRGFGRFDVLVLALMLAYVIATTFRVSYRSCLARPKGSFEEDGSAAKRRRKELIADFNLKARNLKSITSVAPFLGLSGACIGVLDAFVGVGMQKAAAALLITMRLGVVFTTTAAALLVAISANLSHNYIRARIEALETEIGRCPLKRWNRSVGIAQYLPLAPSISRISYAATAAQVFAIVLVTFTVFSHLVPPQGLSVRLMRPSMAGKVSLAIKVIRREEGIVLFVNSREMQPAELDDLLLRLSDNSPQPTIYLDAEDQVSWSDVTTVIDAVERFDNNVVLTSALRPSFDRNDR